MVVHQGGRELASPLQGCNLLGPSEDALLAAALLTDSGLCNAFVFAEGTQKELCCM